MTQSQALRKKKAQAKSADPKMIRRRVRIKNDQLMADLEVDVERYFGKPVSEWDFQELQAGKPRKPDGSLDLRGPAPDWVTPAIMAEAQRRLKLMTRDRLGHYAGSAIAVMAKLMKNSRSDLVKFQAAKYILDQIIGMPTMRVDINEGPSVADFLADVMIQMNDRHDVISNKGYIDGKVVDVEYDEDDDEEDDGE